jgi:multidrug resistance efflux pump
MNNELKINEVDIQKIAKGQDVRIKLDADPNKNLTGKILLGL